jgi:hypothetical protein
MPALYSIDAVLQTPLDSPGFRRVSSV